MNKVEDEELLAILDDLSSLEVALQQEIEIVHSRQEAARREIERELEEKERIKAENIQLAIEKIKEASPPRMLPVTTPLVPSLTYDNPPWSPHPPLTTPMVPSPIPDNPPWSPHSPRTTPLGPLTRL